MRFLLPGGGGFYLARDAAQFAVLETHIRATLRTCTA
jgi:hypothetical protein